MDAKTTMANQNKMFMTALHMRVKDKDKERHDECLFSFRTQRTQCQKSKYQLHGWIWRLVQSMQSMLRAQPISWSVVKYDCIREENRAPRRKLDSHHSRYILRFVCHRTRHYIQYISWAYRSLASD